MLRTMITLAAFLVWNIADYFGIRLIFEHLYISGILERKRYRYFWLPYSFAVSALYCISKMYFPGIICNILFVLFYTRMVPFIWSGYGISIKSMAFICLYEEIEAVFSMSGTIALAKSLKLPYGMHIWLDDMLASAVAVVLLLLILFLTHLKENKGLRIWLSDLKTWEYLMLILAIWFAGTIESSIWFGSSGDQLRIFSAILLLLVFAMAFDFIFVNFKNYVMKSLVDLLDNQMRSMTDFCREINERDTEIRKYRHDSKNHILALYAMIEKGQDKEALTYLRRLDDCLYANNRVQFNTGNYIADAMLSSKEGIARGYGTLIAFNGMVPAQGIDDKDMVVILSNLLDNAIEACMKLDGEKKICINSACENRTWAIDIRNPAAEQVSLESGNIITTKKDPISHGFGLTNVKEAVKKYSGTIKINSNDSEFSIRITVFLK